MGTESFPALLFVIQLLIGAVGILCLVAVGISAFIYYKIRKYNHAEARAEKKNLRSQMQFGLIAFMVCSLIVSLLFFVGPLIKYLLIGA